MGRRGVWVIAIIIAISFLVVSHAVCAEGESLGTKAKNFWQRLFNYPAKVVEKSGETVAETTKNTAGVVGTTMKETTDVVTGRSENPARMVSEPVKETAETIGTAVKDTVSIPVEAAEETQEAPAAESK